MSANAIAISRTLVASGLELTAANAIAEVVVTHADDTVATKTDLGKLDTKIEVLSAKVDASMTLSKISVGMMSGVFIVLVADILMR